MTRPLSKPTTHTVLVQVTLTIEVDVEATSTEEATRLAKTFALDDKCVSGTMRSAEHPTPDKVLADFDQTIKVLEVTR